MAVILGAYELESELGRGAMGRVFRARHLPTGAVRALKVLEDSSDDESLLRFRREAAALAQGGGEGVVPVHESGVHEGKLYFAMELMGGGSLAAKLHARGRLPWREGVALVASLGRSLGRYHARGVVHRDLKPANVLFDEEGRPLLADFGLVRDPTAPSITESGVYLGTPSYSSPEQLAGEKVGAAADVFSLGVVLYEVVAGEVPHSGTTLFALARAVQAGKRRPVAGVGGAPDQLDVVLERALHPDRSRRYPDGVAFANALEALLAGKGEAHRSRAGWLVGAMLLTLGGVVGASALVGPHTERPGAEGPLGFPTGATPPPPVVHAAEVEPLRERAQLAKAVTELLEKGSYELADGVTDRAIAAVGTAFVLALHGEVSLEAGDVQGALDLSRQALVLNPREPRAFAVEAEVLLRRRDRAAAIACATSAITFGDTSARARSVRSRGISDDRPELGKVDLDRVIDDGERSLELNATGSAKLFEILARAYNLRTLRDDVARSSADANRSSQLRNLHDAALQRSPRPDEDLVQKAMRSLEKKDCESTVDYATRALALNPRRAPAHWLRGAAIVRQLGDRPGTAAALEGAIIDLEKAFALDPDGNAPVHLSEGLGHRARHLLEERNDSVAAEAEATRALELYPKNALALFVRGKARRERDPDAAIEDLKRSLERAPASLEAAEIRKLLADLERS